VLANLGRCGALDAGELAERSSMDKPKITRAVQRLEAAAWRGGRSPLWIAARFASP
jgi:DNA-binding MarR family transcriptional regulator